MDARCLQSGDTSVPTREITLKSKFPTGWVDKEHTCAWKAERGLFVLAGDANDAAAGMTVIIRRIRSDQQRAGDSNTFVFAVLKSCGNLRRSLLAFRQLCCRLLYVTNCAFYLIRLLASLSNGNECALPKTGCIVHCRHVVSGVSKKKTVESPFYSNNVNLYDRGQSLCLNVSFTCNLY